MTNNDNWRGWINECDEDAIEGREEKKRRNEIEEKTKEKIGRRSNNWECKRSSRKIKKVHNIELRMKEWGKRKKKGGERKKERWKRKIEILSVRNIRGWKEMNLSLTHSLTHHSCQQSLRPLSIWCVSIFSRPVDWSVDCHHSHLR